MLDRFNFTVEKERANAFIIDLTDCKYDHKILFSQPYENVKVRWKLYDSNGNIIGIVYEDQFFELKNGKVYYFETSENIDDYDLASSGGSSQNVIPGFEFIIFIGAILLIFLIKRNRK